MATIDSNTLFVWDFDWTILDENSDTYVVKKLNNDVYKKYLHEWSSKFEKWVDGMNTCFDACDDTSVSKCEEILVGIPLIDRFKDICDYLNSRECQQCIISDANCFFISTILRHHSVLTEFQLLAANHATFRPNLLVDAYHDSKVFNNCPSRSIGLASCSGDMCKGCALIGILATNHFPSVDYNVNFKNVKHCDSCILFPKAKGGFVDSSVRTIVYIGDGHGDICPCTLLKPTDYILCRSECYLAQFIANNPEKFKAKCMSWTSGVNLLEILRSL